MKIGQLLNRHPCPKHKHQTEGTHPPVRREAYRPVQSVPEVAMANAGRRISAEQFVADSLSDYQGPKDPSEIAALGEHVPLVSIVMTTFNVKETVWSAIFSLMSQSWPNLEIIVCDDHSTDGTWETLNELRRLGNRSLRILRMATNGGTYLARNAAISMAKGEYILFQDSDDQSHPDRVLIQVLPLIADPDLTATNCRYCRYNPRTGDLVEVNGLQSRYGPITLAVRRALFDEIGYFDAVRRAGDEEWRMRLVRFKGSTSIKRLDVTLYIAELSEGSLFADIARQSADGVITQELSPSRQLYVKMFEERLAVHGENSGWFRRNFPAAPLRPASCYPDGIAALSPPRDPVFASVCGIPSRRAQLLDVVTSLSQQVDHLFVHLDRFDEAPPELRAWDNVSVRLSKEYGGHMRDNAKFLPYNDLKREYGSFYFLTCDDDLVYPNDYVRSHLMRLSEFDNRVVTGLHGVVCAERPLSYFSNRYVLHFARGLRGGHQLVNNLGTGTVAFHSDLFDELSPVEWGNGGMVDIVFAVEARKRRIPLLCVDRHDGWLRSAELPRQETTLYDEGRQKESRLLNALVTFEPWGFESILDAVNAQIEPYRSRLSRLMPRFVSESIVAKAHDRMRG
jgi:glycosyltransferase involved in cell wall biosynthesis